ncbi:MAG: DUF2807 domain-containing protein [Clostridia bacterium]|nr:DUF2807 domain-containing protein [Clostridia bacterium]
MSSFKHFAKTVSDKRKEKKLTQEALAARLGISPQAISKWENGMGLPDVTLFPVLAETLGVSLEELFGVGAAEESSRVPPTYGGLPMAGTGARRVCYSAKPVVEQKGEKILFGDGSEADLESGWSTNCGAGEIRIYKMEEISWGPRKRYSGEIKTVEETYSNFDSVYLSVSRYCSVRVLKSEDEKGRLEITANEEFLDATTITCENKLLKVHVKSRNNGDSREESAIKVFVPFNTGRLLHLSLYGECKANVKPDFAEGEIKISGCGEIQLGSFSKRLYSSISGSGSIQGGDSLGNTTLRVSGSGDMRFGRLNNVEINIAGSAHIEGHGAEGSTKVKISGSGDLELGEVRGTMEAKITGSGEIFCSGELEKLVYSVSGSGGLQGKGLTVTDAEIHTVGAGDVELGWIKGRSLEKLSKNSILKVGRRG